MGALLVTLGTVAGGPSHSAESPVSTLKGSIALRDYVDVAELRIRATRLASACGLCPSDQGLVALAVTDAGVFALQHAHSPEAALSVEDDETAPHLTVVVRGTGAVAAEAETVFRPTGQDHLGLMLAARAAERFSVSTQSSSGTIVTMGWALAPGTRGAENVNLVRYDDSEDAGSSTIDVLREIGEVVVLLEVLRRADAAIEDKAVVFAQLTEKLEATNRLVGGDPDADDTSEAGALLTAIVRSSTDGIFSMTPDLAVTSWNPGAEILLGYSARSMIGRRVHDIVPEEESEEFAESMRRLETGDQVTIYNTVRRHSDGTFVEVTSTMSAVRDGHGRLIGYATSLRDLTDRNRLREHLFAALADRERLLEEDRVARNLHDIVAGRLFACAIALQSVRQLDPRPEVVSRIDDVIDELDSAIDEVRPTPFESHHGHSQAIGVRPQLLELGAETAAALGSEPCIRFVERRAPLSAKAEPSAEGRMRGRREHL